MRFSPRIYGVLVEDGKVLLTHSEFTGGPGKGHKFVNFPGGGIESGEAPIEALKREYREETGLEIRPLRTLYVSEGAHLSTWVPIQLVCIYWLVERVSGELNMGGNGDDVLDLFWAPVDAVPTDGMFPADLEFIEKLPALL